MSASQAGGRNLSREVEMKANTKKITLLGIFTSVALILSFVEMLLPPIWSAVPGIKMGLANVIIIFLLYKFSFKEAAAVSFVRLVATALLFGNALTFIYSLSGAAFSLGIMWVFKKTGKFSKVGVSISGAVFHNMGQIIVAALILSTKEIGYYFPVLAVSGIVSGIFVGLLGIILLKYTEKINID